jgi:hypothetical protein
LKDVPRRRGFGTEGEASIRQGELASTVAGSVGKDRSKNFDRKVDASQYLVGLESDKLSAALSDAVDNGLIRLSPCWNV